MRWSSSGLLRRRGAGVDADVDWMDLCPFGVLAFDGAGRVRHCNAALVALAGEQVQSLEWAPPGLAELVGWDDGQLAAALAGAPGALERSGSVDVRGQRRRLRATVRARGGDGAARRCLALIQPQAAVPERADDAAAARELAALGIGALVGTAGAGVATFEPASGVVRQASPGAGAGGDVLAQTITRELVAPESRAEYERLQRAIRSTERVEVRYAIDHPTLGRRWLSTCVEPATLASGERSASVVTLDVTREMRRAAKLEETEHAKDEAEAALRRVIEAAPLAIAVFDARTRDVRHANAIAERRLLGAQDGFEITMLADLDAAHASAAPTLREYRLVDGLGGLAIWDAHWQPLADEQVLLVATDVTEQRIAQEARFAAAIAQRDLLVREVHHRIKNNLQGVAGLLEQISQRKPDTAAAISEVVAQVQAIAEVHGLQVGNSGPLVLHQVVETIARSVQRTFGRAIACTTMGDVGWRLPEWEAIPIALVLNELLTNAAKHGAERSAVRCRLGESPDSAQLTVENDGKLPADFDLEAFPNGASGLGLVRALLPRRGASFAIDPRGDAVRARLVLKPPALVAPPAAAA